MRANLPPQITRLLLLTLGIVAAYAMAKHFLTPRSWGEFGWYRGDALREVAAHKPVFAGKVACAQCHTNQLAQLTRFEHKTISCEACHGVQSAHLMEPKAKTVKPMENFCARCHEQIATRPAIIKQVVSVAHYKGQGGCLECHLPHHPKEAP